MTFSDFIRQQDSRLDPVGDLAKFLISGKPKIGGYLQIKRWLYEQEGVDDDLHQALELAFDEFAVAVSRHKRAFINSPLSSSAALTT